MKMRDDELENISGGFEEKNKALDTYGMEIKCPSCGNTKKERFSPVAFKDPKTGSVEYRCNCGCAFVCYEKQVILKQDWIDKCKEKKYTYPFQ